MSASRQPSKAALETKARPRGGPHPVLALFCAPAASIMRHLSSRAQRETRLTVPANNSAGYLSDLRRRRAGGRTV